MNQIVSSDSNVISTRQTCGQRSGMATGSKRWALPFYFSARICYMLLISKCRGESDLGLCMTSVLAGECHCAVPTSNESYSQTRVKIGSRHCTAAFSLQVPKSCTHLDFTLFYILIFRTYTKFVRKDKMLQPIADRMAQNLEIISKKNQVLVPGVPGFS